MILIFNMIFAKLIVFKYLLKWQRNLNIFLAFCEVVVNFAILFLPQITYEALNSTLKRKI